MKLPGHGQGRPLDAHVADLVAVPLAPEKGIDVPVAEAVDGRWELALEGEAAHLTVRHHVEPGLLLEREGLVHGSVLDFPEALLADLAGLEPRAGFEEGFRAQKAADDVGAGREHGLTLRPRGYHSDFAPRRGSRV